MSNKKLIASIIGVALILMALCAYQSCVKAAEAEELEQQARAQQVQETHATIADAQAEELERENHAAGQREREAAAEAEREAQERAEAEQAEAQAELEAPQAQQVVASTSYVTPTSGLTREGGVNYYNGSRETWYSSNVLYHYRTSEWTVGEDGVYRDADGYVVVARSDMAQGDTIETSLGTGRVYDTGCAAGTTDIYTSW